MYTHQTTLRVRYAETDQMGYVYYGNYAAYFEVGRVEALRALGYSYRGLEDAGVMMPVLEHHTRYRSPLKYDDEFTIETRIEELPSGSRLRFIYSILNPEGKECTTGYTDLVFVKMETGRPIPAPKDFLDTLRAHF
jgi:acyl-CoA thioester hydrolase